MTKNRNCLRPHRKQLQGIPNQGGPPHASRLWQKAGNQPNFHLLLV